ncbi:MAG: transglycosylase SLT domain-containing protein [Bacteroidetes bacterium]|nr:transglycosylase SLT domain-containing protein [Bacteroidota bacterium]
MKYFISFVFITLVNIQFVSCTEPSKAVKQVPAVTSPNEGNFAKYMSSLKFPDQLSFCGERVPLEIPEVRERAEREFYLNLQSPGQLILYIKRSGRYFPMFEQIIKEEKAPEDLKYLAIAESALFMARSSKDAVGIWQFIATTGRHMGLQIDDYVDERRNPEKSTKAAIAYLKSGYNQKQSWTLAAAGYNMGHENLGTNLEFQDKNSFYDLYLNEETSRYILRIAVIKEIIENADYYGITIDPKDRYQPDKVRVVQWKTSIPDIAKWAEEHGTNYKDVKLLNPWILKRNLPSPKGGVYQIAIPN